MDVSLLESIFAQIDADGDGKVSHAEWCSMLGVGIEEERRLLRHADVAAAHPADAPIAGGRPQSPEWWVRVRVRVRARVRVRVRVRVGVRVRVRVSS